MVGNVFYIVLNMSILSVALFLFLLVFRWLNSKVTSKNFIYGLWFVMIVRLLIPVSINSSLSIMNLVDDEQVRSVVVDEYSKGYNSGKIETTYLNAIQIVEDYELMTYKTNRSQQILNSAGKIWIMGVILFLLTIGISYSLVNKQIRRFEKNKVKRRIFSRIGIEIKVYESEQVSSPFLWGFRSILLPTDLSEINCEYVICHETVHVNRLDNIWKGISLIALAFHWFNPFVWLFYRYFIQDMEKACDYKVLSIIGEDKKDEYAKTLIHLAEEKQYIYAGLGQSAVKKRIMSIVNYKKMSFVMTSILSIVWLMLFAMLVTNR